METLINPYRPSGWKYESTRHSLARRGIKTRFKFGDVPDSLFDKSQLKKGQAVELEHTDDNRVAEQIAKAHLVERPDYYKRLEKVESSKPGKIGSVHGVPVIADKINEGSIYPISASEVEEVLGKMPADDLKGVKAIEFSNPKGEQKSAWAQYVRSTRTLKLFSQPFKNGKVDGQDPEWLRKHMREYVLPHEIGHHKALYKDDITDKDLEMAEARADANVVGMDARDKDVKVLKAMRSYNAPLQ